jgi:PAS domain S-box-containing protein
VVYNTFGAAKQREYDNIKSSGVIFNPFDIYFAVAKGKNRKIIETLDRYLTEWRKEESSPYHQARERWAHGSASTIPVTPAWLRRAIILFLLSTGMALAFIILLRVQVKRKTSELKSEIAEHIKTTDELHATAAQLEEELVERELAQEALQEQTALLEEEIEERSRVEETVRAEKERSDQYLNIAQVIMVAFDDQARITLINRKGYEVLGYEEGELIGKDWFRVCLPPEEYETVCAVYNRLMAGDVDPVEYYENYILTKDGKRRLIGWRNTLMKDRNGRIVGSLSSGEDITERKQLEEQLRHSQKIEAVGQLAGGIAHDFNNILQVITGYGALLKMSHALGADDKKALDRILSSADKAAQLTRGLLAFSRKQVMTLFPTNLNDIVQNVQDFLARIIGEDIQLKIITYGKGLTIYADKGQIEQVLINLATNSRDAMQKGGLLTIETGLQVVETPIDHESGRGKQGRYAVVTVSDNGSGMNQETCARIFEPFYTTKEVGKGTGLGLAIVDGIVRQHKGFINVYSEPGQGTAFKIYLPVYEAEQPQQNDAVQQSATQRGGTETILLAEDDADVRKLVVTVLTTFGYRVIQAVDGQDAVEKFAANRERIDMILMDMIMPKKNGKEAYGEISALQPGVKILYSSGYTADFIQSRGVSEEGIELIMKPVQPTELLRKVREALDSKYAGNTFTSIGT